MSLSRSCRLWGVSRQAIYQQAQREQQRQRNLSPVRDLVLEARGKLPGIGGRKLYHLLKPAFIAHSIKIGRDGFFDYLRNHRLLIFRKKQYIKTTNSKHWLRKYPNLYAGLTISRPEQVFVSDITYIESHEGMHYLSLVTDAFSRRIMGYELSHDLRAAHMVSALKQALAARTGSRSLIHHSDRGLQYCSGEYQQELRENQVMPSMTEGYDCYQNALAERVNGILKEEFLKVRCSTFQELKKVVEQSIAAYNQLRPHLSLGMKTPLQVHNEKSAALSG